MTRGLLLTAVVVALLGAFFAHRGTRESRPYGRLAEVVVTLAPPASGSASATQIDRAQAVFTRRLARAVPSAHVRWRYRVVLDGVSVVLRAADVSRLRTLPGVDEVYASTRYATASSGPAVDQIGARQLWTPGLTSAGDGIKIGIIDGGVDQSHPFFDPTGYTMPPGFPKGQLDYTTAKVIVARTFPAPGQTGKARLPFDADASSAEHGTHVAGIAAGNADTRATGDVLVSGVAPRAYIGNYRAFTVPTDSGVGEDANAPELVAAIEAAVKDGMNVINLSIGEAEVEPSRDLVALALDGAARAGVVPVVAAGNEFRTYGQGSLFSPGTSAQAITTAAVTTVGAGQPANVTADFSSAGPTPISLRLKPDVSAPGTNVLSAVHGGWESLSGTSMATPHVAGGAALLRQRHPDWSVAQLKSALVETGDDVWADGAHTTRALPTRGGGGLIDLPRADQPLIFTSPSSLSLGLVRPGSTARARIGLTDAGGGAGTWAVSLERASGGAVNLAVPPSVEVPGSLAVSVTPPPTASEGGVTGFIVLQRGADRRRIPFWLRVERPLLAKEPVTTLTRPGVHRGNTRGRASKVTTYRYPEVPHGRGIATTLAGPEQVFRFRLRRPVANFGVAIVSRGGGVTVEPRVVVAGDENRLTGFAAIPLVLNPYLADVESPVLAAGAVRPAPGVYDIVFDSRNAAGAGRFSFRFWIDDTTPPTARLLTRTIEPGQPLVLRVADGGSGVDWGRIVARLDGVARRVSVGDGEVRVDTAKLAPGRHRLRFQVSDYQETRNMENVPAILPNTRRLTTTIVVR